MIIFLYGPDTYRSQEKLDQLKEKFKREIDKSGGNIFIFNEDNADQGVIKNALFTHSFLVKKKMVVFKRITKFSKKILEDITDWLKKLENDQNLILIFWEEDIDSKIKISKTKRQKDKPELIVQLKKVKYAYEFSLLAEEKLRNWIKDRVEKWGAKIDSCAIDLLIIFVGSNLWQMNQEIHKLAAYKGKETINKEDVELLTKSKLDENIFHLVDAVGGKNMKMALKLVNEQIESGINSGYLLTMLIREFKILLQVKDFLDNEKKYSNSSSRFNLHPFVVKKAMCQSQKYSLEELKKIYNQLLDIDFRAKTSQIDSKVILDLFIVKLCSV